MSALRRLAAPLLVAAASAGQLSFDEYCAAYGKSYSGQERVQRKALYDARVAEHARLNARPGATWTAGPGPLTDLLPDEMRRFLGYAGRPGGVAPQGGLAPMAKAADDLPRELDWRQRTPRVVNPPQMQGWCGSCWAFAATATIESAVALATGKLLDLSRQQLTSCAPNPQSCGGSGGCGGSTAWLAYNYTAQHGLASQELVPYVNGDLWSTNACKLSQDYHPMAGITGYVRLPTNDAPALLRAVATHGPVSVSVDSWDWGMYESGIFDDCNKTSPVINHVVVLVAYGEERGVKYWTLQNSFGKEFGEDGYIRLRRYEEGDEPCGMNTQPEVGSGCEGGPPEQWVCGECGILSDSAYPTGAFLSAGGRERRLNSAFLA